MVARLAILILLASGCFAQPRRIVSTAPSVTEMLYALGLGDRVMGVTTFCRYPPEAARKPKIGNYLRPDVEAIVALRPDLVIAEKSMTRQALSLPGLKLNLLEVDDSTIPGIYDSIRTIGRAAGVGPKAQEVCTKIAADLDAVRRRTSRLPPWRVLFVVGRTPGKIEDLIAAGGTSYLGELIRIAGGDNILRDAAIPYAKVSLEEVFARDPDVIIDMGEMAQTVGTTDRQKQAVVSLWRRYPVLKAVRDNRVFAVASDIFVVPGPRVTQAASELARLVHPEAPK
ncbi:MAG: Vitamin transporter, B12-binding component BtuF [candidate division NC10 bacterium]|nr:Vitamin transporter, B12-binding component BtuF [candidate division NC10 bacterium]